MESDIDVNSSTRVWVESLDNVSFVIGVKLSAGKTILGDPMDRTDLKILAEDLIDGMVNQILHIAMTGAEGAILGERLLAIANGRW